MGTPWVGVGVAVAVAVAEGVAVGVQVGGAVGEVGCLEDEELGVGLGGHGRQLGVEEFGKAPMRRGAAVV